MLGRYKGLLRVRVLIETHFVLVADTLIAPRAASIPPQFERQQWVERNIGNG